MRAELKKWASPYPIRTCIEVPEPACTDFFGIGSAINNNNFIPLIHRVRPLEISIVSLWSQLNLIL